MSPTPFLYPISLFPTIPIEDIELSPTIDLEVFPYKNFYQLDSEGNRVLININVSKYGENLVIEKVVDGNLIARVTLIRSEIIDNPSANIGHKCEFALLDSKYATWKIEKYIQNISRENFECQERYARERKQRLENDYIGKMFYHAPKYVIENTTALLLRAYVISSIFFLSSHSSRKNSGSSQYTAFKTNDFIYFVPPSKKDRFDFSGFKTYPIAFNQIGRRR
jgi:hypothetical protein